MKRKLINVAMVMVLIGLMFSFAPTPTAKAAPCTTNCYFAFGVFMRNTNGTPFTGTREISCDLCGTPRTEHFTNGVNDSGYIWSGYRSGTWYGTYVYAKVSGVTKGYTYFNDSYTSAPFLPDVVTIYTN